MTGDAAGDSDALREALAEALPLWWKAEPPYTATIERLLPLVLAYGHEQATRAAEQALRVAQMRHCETIAKRLAQGDLFGEAS